MTYCKIFFVCLFLAAKATFGQDKYVKFKGKTEYSQQSSSELYTQFEANYKATVFEPKHKKWCYSLGGKISADYDHFGNETKINVFTVFGVDF